LTSNSNVGAAGVGNRLVLNFPGTLVNLRGNAATWQISSTLAQPDFHVASASTNVFFNGTAVTGSILIATQQSSSVIGSTLSEIARAALLEAQDTDSVAKQIIYGFAGDVGTTPPMNHQIDDTGISVPACFNDSREGQTCK
jgi:hypothetical protein